MALAGRPQWSPVMKTGNTWITVCTDLSEYAPQWSPVMKTGNTSTHPGASPGAPEASMEPGHEDREYGACSNRPPPPPERLNGARS